MKVSSGALLRAATVRFPHDTGTEYQNGCEVLSGLKKDDLVILEPELVKDGDPVKVDS